MFHPQLLLTITSNPLTFPICFRRISVHQFLVGCPASIRKGIAIKTTLKFYLPSEYIFLGQLKAPGFSSSQPFLFLIIITSDIYRRKYISVKWKEDSIHLIQNNKSNLKYSIAVDKTYSREHVRTHAHIYLEECYINSICK